jgi:hypothetical protein
MIEINLLPEELKKKKRKIEIPKIEFLPIIVIAVIAVVALQLLLSFTLTIKRTSLKRLEARWGNLKPEEKDAMVIKRQINRLLDKISHIERIKSERTLWAEKLSALSDSMMSGIWLTKFSVNERGEKKLLSITGSVSSTGKDEAAMIGRFMKQLKDNPGFFRDFSEIELGTIQQKTRKNIETMEFVIHCYFKERNS